MDLMKDRREKAGVKGNPYDISKDFKVLTSSERRGILKTAKTLEKIQAENLSMLADAPAPPIEAESEKGLG
jgi:hypothetical protein